VRVDNPIKVHFHLGEKEAGATRNIFGQIGRKLYNYISESQIGIWDFKTFCKEKLYSQGSAI
jgi:hypothetical protein